VRGPRISSTAGSSTHRTTIASRNTAAAYIRFATADPALLELMFAVKHREQAGVLQEAAERAFSVMLEVILQGQAEGWLEPGDPERVGLVLFATIQGIAALLTGGMVAPEQLDELLDDSIAHFLRGSASAAKRRGIRERRAVA